MTKHAMSLTMLSRASKAKLSIVSCGERRHRLQGHGAPVLELVERAPQAALVRAWRVDPQQPTPPPLLALSSEARYIGPPVFTTDLRAPDQVAPVPPAAATDLRAPDQQAPRPAVASYQKLVISKAHRPVAASPTAAAPAPALDDGPAAIVFVLIGVGGALVLLAGGYVGVRLRHRVAVADDLVTH